MTKLFAAGVRNTGQRDGVEVVQLYLHDPVASVVRPVNQLIGYRRIEVPAGARVRVEFEVPADLASFTGRVGLHHTRAMHCAVAVETQAATGY